MVADARCPTCGGVKRPNGTTGGLPWCRCNREPAEKPAHPYAFGSKVIADGDACNKMVVTGFLYRPEAALEVECAYWINGDLKSVWLPAWRLTVAPEF